MTSYKLFFVLFPLSILKIEAELSGANCPGGELSDIPSSADVFFTVVRHNFQIELKLNPHIKDEKRPKKLKNMSFINNLKCLTYHGFESDEKIIGSSNIYVEKVCAFRLPCLPPS